MLSTLNAIERTAAAILWRKRENRPIGIKGERFNLCSGEPGFIAYTVSMNMLETINIDVYPWAVPTAEQRAWFDALSPDEKRKAIQVAIEEGFSSPQSGKSIEDILREARAESPDAS